eukprot:208860_1
MPRPRSLDDKEAAHAFDAHERTFQSSLETIRCVRKTVLNVCTLSRTLGNVSSVGRTDGKRLKDVVAGVLDSESTTRRTEQKISQLEQAIKVMEVNSSKLLNQMKALDISHPKS